MVPVGEERAKVVTPLTDIQLLQPVTATMLGKGTGGGRAGRREGGGGSEEEGKNEGWNKEWRRGNETRNMQEGENHVNDCKEKQGERRRKGGKRVLLVCQSVPGRLAENSGHVRPCETF